MRVNHSWALDKKQALIGLAILIGLAVIVLLVFVRVELEFTEGELGVPLDDAWIHFQFARNISQGNGFSFNAGEPTPGSTAPLWTVLLAGIGLMSHEFLTWAIGLSALFFLLTIAFSYGLTAELSGSRAVGLVAAAGVLLSGRLVWAGLAGMETTAFTALSMAAIWLYAKKGLNPAAALLFGLASQARPEGHALFALAIADASWTTFRGWFNDGTYSPQWGGLMKGMALPILVYLAVSLPYTLFSLNQTGRPLANTFYAKVDTAQLFSPRTLRETVIIHFRDNPIAFLLLLPGIGQTWRRSRLVVAWLILLPILSAFMVDFIWHHGRYTMPLIPIVSIVAAQGIEWLVDKLPSRSRAYAAAALVVVFVVSGAWQLPRWAQQLGQNSREIIAIDVAIGKWLAENTAPEAMIAVDDIGAIGYLSGRKIFDLNGLVSPEMWPILHEEPQGHLRNEATTRLLSQIGPDYLAIFPPWHFELANNRAVTEPVQSFQSDSRTIIGEQEAVVYETQWPYLMETAAPDEAIALLGEQVELLDYEVLAPSEEQAQLEVSLLWRATAPIADSYDVFVHVLDSEGAIVAQADGKPVLGLAPTSRWQTGDIVKDAYLIELPADLAEGQYSVQAGMYLRETGRRLPVNAAKTREDAVVLGDFTR